MIIFVDPEMQKDYDDICPKRKAIFKKKFKIKMRTLTSIKKSKKKPDQGDA